MFRNQLIDTGVKKMPDYDLANRFICNRNAVARIFIYLPANFIKSVITYFHVEIDKYISSLLVNWDVIITPEITTLPFPIPIFVVDGRNHE